MFSEYLLFLAGLNGGVLAGIAVGVVLAVAICFSCVFFFVILPKKRRIEVRHLTEKFQEIASRLENDCGVLIRRLETLSVFSPVFKDALEDIQSRYETIIRTSEAAAKRRVNDLSTGFERGNRTGTVYRYGRRITAARTDVDEFSREVSSFRGRLDQILSEDTRIHREIARIGIGLREFKEFYSENKDSLSPVRPVLEFLFKGLDNRLEQLEVYTDKAEYQEADSLLEQLSSVVDTLNRYRETLIDVIARAGSLLPERMEILYLNYLRLTSEGLPLDHLGVDKAVESMCCDIQRVRDSLSTLDLGNDEEILDRVSGRIDDLERSFLYERDCDQKLKGMDLDFTSRVSSFLKDFDELERQYHKFSEKFVISPFNRKLMKEIVERRERLLNDKNYLDEITHATAPQPCSLILEKSEQLSRNIEDSNSDIASLRDYLTGLKNDFDNVSSELDRIFVVIYETIREARELEIPNFLQSVERRAEGLLWALDEIKASISVTPCYIEESIKPFAEVDSASKEFIHQIEAEIEMAEKVEELVVFANRYRVDYHLARSGLPAAEDYFLRGEFAEASKILRPLILQLIEVVDSQSEVVSTKI